MKAYCLFAANNLQYQDIPIPDLQPGWVLVKVKAAGICSSDIPRIYTLGTYHFPTIPGHEFSGIVEYSYGNIDKYWIGKRVSVFPLIPCQKCLQCKQKRFEMCEHYDYIGSRRDGAFAEFVAVPTWNLIEIPDTISFEEAALMEPLSVALHAVKKLGCIEGKKIAIIGTGTIGFAAALWLKVLGASKVSIVGRDEHKRSLVKCFSNIEYIVSTSMIDLYDCVIEAVGVPQTICKAINMTKAGGSVVLVGNPSDNILIDRDTYWRILKKQLIVTGTWNSFYNNDMPSDWTEVRDALVNKRINVKKLITYKFKQENLTDGLILIKNHQKTYCKIMTIWNHD